MAAKITCCKNCVAPKRHIGCHGSCEEYIKQKKKLDEINEKARIERDRYKNITAYDFEGNACSKIFYSGHQQRKKQKAKSRY